MRSAIEDRLVKLERHFRHRIGGAHRYTDGELDDLIAWLKDPQPEREAWAVALLRREGRLS